jgi:hypothetical protein
VFISVLSVKRQTQQKTRNERERKGRERKELDALGRKQFANVRVVQRNIVYVVGLGSRFAKEEVLHITSTALVCQAPPPCVKVSGRWSLHHISST